MKIFAISLGVLIVGLLAAFVGGTLWFGTYVGSDPFRALVAEATGSALRSQAELAPLRWSGSSAYSESARLLGRPDAAIKTLSASQVRADVNWRALFSGAWRVEDITITQLDAAWQRPGEPDAGGDLRTLPSPPPLVAALLPRKFELGTLNVASANLSFGGSEIEATSLTVKPDGSGWTFQGKGGSYLSPWTPTLEISDFRARTQGDDIFLTQGRLRLGANGKIAVSGESASGGKLQVSWDGVSTSDILRGGWLKRLQGVLSGTLDLAAPGSASCTLELKEGRLENIPLLATIADFTQNPAFRRMPLQEVTAKFVREGSGWRITEFRAESKGLLRLEGTALVGDDGSLEGQLEVGVTTQTLQWIPGSREKVFTSAKDGYLWAHLTLGGTVENPREDLSGRLVSAMGQAVIEQGGKLIEQMPGSAVEGARSVLDILRPFAP